MLGGTGSMRCCSWCWTLSPNPAFLLSATVAAAVAWRPAAQLARNGHTRAQRAARRLLVYGVGLFVPLQRLPLQVRIHADRHIGGEQERKEHAEHQRDSSGCG